MVPLPPGTSREAVLKVLLNTNFDRVVFLRLMEWKSTTVWKTTLQFDVILEILDNKGKVMAQKQIKGRDRTGKDFKYSVPFVFRNKMRQLFDDPKVREAFR